MKEEFINCFERTIIPYREGADKLLEFLIESSFFEDPASSRYHLNVPGGLCKHSLNVYWTLANLVQGTSIVPAPGTLAIIGLLHDLCKIGCYRQEPRNQKTYDPKKVADAWHGSVKHDQIEDFIWETVMTYKNDDPMPFGHGEKSVYMIQKYMPLTDEEAFAIRFHMGPWQDGEKNNVSKAFEKYPLAMFAHVADMIATYWNERTVENEHS